MTEEERKAITDALQAIASAITFCETDMELVIRDRLEAVHEAIGKLRGEGE